MSEGVLGVCRGVKMLSVSRSNSGKEGMKRLKLSVLKCNGDVQMDVN